jgi:Domain of unknown function DUF29
VALYESDYHQWALDTAAALRSRRIDEVDLDNVAEEIEDLGRSERHKLTNFLVVLITHILKWEHQPVLRTRSWQGSIRESQKRLNLVLEQNPSLKPMIHKAISDAYSIAVTVAATETQIPEEVFPAECPYAWGELISYDSQS